MCNFATDTTDCGPQKLTTAFPDSPVNRLEASPFPEEEDLRLSEVSSDATSPSPSPQEKYLRGVLKRVALSEEEDLKLLEVSSDTP